MISVLVHSGVSVYAAGAPFVEGPSTRRGVEGGAVSGTHISSAAAQTIIRCPSRPLESARDVGTSRR